MRKKSMMLIVVLLLTVCLGFLSAQDDKPRIGVLRFTNNVAGVWWWHSTTADDLQDMLIAELVSSRKFSVLERKEINAVLGEQDLSASGRVSKSTKVKMGKLKGAQYLIAGTVSAFEQASSKGGNVRFKGISLGGKKDKIYIAVDVKLIDTETGEVVDARTIEANLKATAVDAGLSVRNFAINGEEAKKTPTGKAIRACILYIVDYMECSVLKGLDDGCMRKWNEMDEKRKEKTKDSIDLE